MTLQNLCEAILKETWCMLFVSPNSSPRAQWVGVMESSRRRKGWGKYPCKQHTAPVKTRGSSPPSLKAFTAVEFSQAACLRLCWVTEENPSQLDTEKIVLGAEVLFIATLYASSITHSPSMPVCLVSDRTEIFCAAVQSEKKKEIVFSSWKKQMG